MPTGANAGELVGTSRLLLTILMVLLGNIIIHLWRTLQGVPSKKLAEQAMLSKKLAEQPMISDCVGVTPLTTDIMSVPELVLDGPSAYFQEPQLTAELTLSTNPEGPCDIEVEVEAKEEKEVLIEGTEEGDDLSAAKIAHTVTTLTIDASAVARAVVAKLDTDSVWRAHLSLLDASALTEEMSTISSQLDEANAALLRRRLASTKSGIVEHKVEALCRGEVRAPSSDEIVPDAVSVMDVLSSPGCVSYATCARETDEAVAVAAACEADRAKFAPVELQGELFASCEDVGGGSAVPDRQRAASESGVDALGTSAKEYHAAQRGLTSAAIAVGVVSVFALFALRR